MKVIVTGSKGQLGTDVMAELEKIGAVPVGADLPELDITDAEAVENFTKKLNADAVIHCAAFTNVDIAETEKEITQKMQDVFNAEVEK